jgi:hypothetical protein
MDNPVKLATLATHERTRTNKTKSTTQKTEKMSRTHLTKQRQVRTQMLRKISSSLFLYDTAVLRI